MRFILIITFALATSGCVTTTDNRTYRAFNLSKSDIENAKTSVTKALKDPESARFGSIGASTDENGKIYVCGLVNAKNSFGGYTGEQPYMGEITRSSDGKNYFTMTGIDNGQITDIMITVCRNRGIVLI